jgi:hypothetical protein
MTEPVLTEGDRNNATWKRLQDHYEKRLAQLRERNDKPRSHDDTLSLRGRIAEVKELLALGTDKPPTPSEDELFKD